MVILAKSKQACIDNNGNFLLMRHTTFYDKPQYFSGSMNEFEQGLIDSILLQNNYHPDKLVDTPLLIYDDFTYWLDYEITGKDRVQFQYINSAYRTPENILFLNKFLENIATLTSKKIDSFTIQPYIDTLIKLSSNNLLPPPKHPPPPPLNQEKFIPKKFNKK